MRTLSHSQDRVIRVLDGGGKRGSKKERRKASLTLAYCSHTTASEELLLSLKRLRDALEMSSANGSDVYKQVVTLLSEYTDSPC